MVRPARGCVPTHIFLKDDTHVVCWKRHGWCMCRVLVNLLEVQDPYPSGLFPKWLKFKVFSYNHHLSNEKYPGCLGYIGDYTTQFCGGLLVNHYKNAY